MRHAGRRIAILRPYILRLLIARKIIGVFTNSTSAALLGLWALSCWVLGRRVAEESQEPRAEVSSSSNLRSLRLMSARRMTWRWLLLVPAAVAAWFGVLLIGIIAYQVTEHATCPEALMMSGACLDGTVQSTLELVICIFVGLAAVAAEIAAAAIAPSHKVAVS